MTKGEKNMENKIKQKELPQEVYHIYYYLNRIHLGEENGITKPALATMLNMTERELRHYTKIINENSQFERLVSTTHRCYICNTKAECEKSIRNTYRVAIALFKKAKAMEKKVGLNGQIKINLGNDFKDFVETFSSEK